MKTGTIGALVLRAKAEKPGGVGAFLKKTFQILDFGLIDPQSTFRIQKFLILLPPYKGGPRQ
jgi:hypothetical protein